MAEEEFGIREGEIAIELPEKDGRRGVFHRPGSHTVDSP